MNMIKAEMGRFCNGCVLGNSHESLSFHGQIDHRSSVSGSKGPMLMDQCQRSHFEVQSSVFVSMMIIASITMFSSSSKRMKFPSVYARY